MNDYVLLETKANGVYVLTINRPEVKNALSLSLVEDFILKLDEIKKLNPTALILKSKGDVFCSGLDLKGIEERSDSDILHLLLRIEVLLQKIYFFPCSTICFVQKAAIGAGADLFLSCQSRVIEPGGFITFPGIKFGIFLGTRRLSELAGINTQFILNSQEPINTENELFLGLATDIVEKNNWDKYQCEWIDICSNMEPYIRNNINNVLNTDRSFKDMYDLVLSASRPGLKERIKKYINNRS